MLYFLKQTFNMHESHIHSFLTHFPFICFNDVNFRLVPISRANCFNMLPPLMLTSFKAMDVKNKIRMVVEIQKYGFVPGKDNFDCIAILKHTAHR